MIIVGLAQAAETAPAATALPTNGQVVAGTAHISTDNSNASAPVLNVNQASQRAVVNWDKFDVGSAATVNFKQPNAQASTLNRISDPNPSKVFGKINAPGEVVLVNQAGVYFSAGASLDVGSVVATSHSISDADYMAGKAQFDRNGATGKVVNEGQIKTGLSGYVALLAPEVRNSGVIVAQMGTVVMAAGERITLNFDPSRRLSSITTTPSALETLIENKNAVRAPGGIIILSARAVNSLTGGVIKQSGTLSASADSNTLIKKGGRIMLSAGTVTLNAGSKTLARGETGGGAVDVVATKTATVDAGAKVSVSATGNGNGGSISIHSEEKTTIKGTLLAQGGIVAGNGGVISTTSNGQVEIDATAEVKAGVRGESGQVGTWNVTAANVEINQSNAPVIAATLNQANVKVKAQAGNVVVKEEAVIQKTAPVLTTLKMQASNSVVVRGKMLSSVLSPIVLQIISENAVELSSSAALQASQVLVQASMISASGDYFAYFWQSGGGALPLISFMAGRITLAGSFRSGSNGRAGNITVLGLDGVDLQNANLNASGDGGGEVSIVSRLGSVNLTNSIIQTNGGEGRGGAIFVAGLQQTAINATTLEATGKYQGGTILLGNDANNGTLPFSAFTSLDLNSQINAQALESQSGLGGFIETSGHTLNLLATINAGRGGMWLIDPYDIIIGNEVSGTAYSSSFTADQVSYIRASDIVSSLNNSINVSITTGSSTANTIAVYAAITATTGSASLTLTGGTIALSASITTFGAQTYNGNVYVAAPNVTLFSNNADVTVNGAIQNYNNAITLTSAGAYSSSLTGAGTANSTGVLVGDVLLKWTGTQFTFTMPTPQTLSYLVVGGGGGGGVNACNCMNGGGGGGGGGLINSSQGFSSGTQYSVAIGAGGTSGGNGGASSLSGSGLTTVTASGGGAGGTGYFMGAGGEGGTAGAGGGNGGAGGWNFVGLNGAIVSPYSLTGTSYSYASGGGGGSGNGTVVGAAGGGAGGPGAGNGASASAGNTVAVSGAAATNFGAGGGGAYGPALGGAGASGTVVLVNNAAKPLTIYAGSGKVTVSGNISNLSALTIQTSHSDSALAGIISGATSLTKQGGGTLTLFGVNSYTGLTTISAGIIKLGAAGNSTNSPLGGGGTGTVVTGTGGLDLNGYTLTTTEQLSLGSMGGGASGSGALMNSGVAATFSGHITLTAASSIVGGTGTITIRNLSNAIWGGGFALRLGGAAGGNLITQISNTVASLSKVDNGTWLLSGSNTYTGLTTISAGSLQLGNANALGTVAAGTVVTGTGSLDLNGISLATAEPLSLAGTGTSSSGALMNSGAAATYSGLITLTAASSIVGGTGAIAISNVGTITGATFALTLDGAAGGTLTSILGTTSGSLIKQGTGTWVLAGANTYTGSTGISAGTLSVSSMSNAGAAGGLGAASAAASNLVLSGGTLKYTGVSASTNRAFTLSDGTSSSIEVSSAASNLTISGAAASASGSFIKTGAGTLTLSGANAYAGSTTVNAGTLTVTSTGSLGNSSSALNINSGTLNMQRDLSVASLLMGAGSYLRGAGNLVVSTTSSLAGTIATNGPQTYNGDVSLIARTSITTPHGNISFNGTVNSASTTPYGLGFSLGTGTVVFGDDAADTVGATHALDYISISGAMELNAAIVNAASLTVGYAADLGADVTTSGAQIFNGALTLSSNVQLTGSTVTTNHTLIGANYALTITGNAVLGDGLTDTISGLTSLSVSGTTSIYTNTVTTTGTQTYNGALTIGANNYYATLTGSTVTTHGNLIGAYLSGLAVSGDAVFGDASSDSVSGLHSLSVSGTTDIYTGSIGIYGPQTYSGAVTLHANSTISNSTPWALAILFGSTVNGAYSLSISNTGSTTFTGALGGSSALTGLTVSSGTLTAAAISLADNSALAITNSGAGSITGIIDGVGVTLTKAGLGTLSLSGANTYGGATTINAGTLTVSNTGSLGNSSSALGINSATLNIQRAITVGSLSMGGSSPAIINSIGTGSLIVNGTSSLAGSIRTIGVQTYSGAVTLLATTTLSATAAVVNLNSTVNGAQALSVNSTGNSSLSGTIGGITPLASLSFISSADLLVGDIASLGDVLLNAVGSFTMDSGKVLTAGGNLVINSTHFVNYGNLSAGGYWQVWSSNSDPFNGDPSIGDVVGGLVPDYKQYNATYGITTALGTGNGLLYSYAPSVTASWVGSISKVYDGGNTVSLTAANFTLSSGVAGESLVIGNATSGTFTTAGTSVNISDVGTGKTVQVSTVDISSASNGTMAVYGYQSISVSLSIGGAEITKATAKVVANKTYDGTVDLTSVQVMITGVTLGANTQVLGYTGMASTSNGNVLSSNKYVVVDSMALANGGSGSTAGLASNYDLPSSAYSATYNYATVNTRPITGTPTSGQAKVYGEADTTLNFSLEASSTGRGLVSGDSFTGALGRAIGENVGTAYAINQGSLANSNYAISMASVNYAISTRPIIVTPTSGQAKVYGEADGTLNYTLEASNSGRGLVSGDSFSGALGRAMGENVGTAYAINQGSLANSNYAISMALVNYAITTRPIIVTPTSGQAKVYGETDSTLTYTLETSSAGRGLVVGDSFSGALARATGEDVNSYAISQGNLANSNYAISMASVNYAISAKPVVISSSNSATTYDGVSTYEDFANAAGFSTDVALVGSDAIGAFTQAVTVGGLAATGVAQAGNFVATPSAASMTSGSASNYAFTYSATTNTVAKANLSIAATASLSGNVYNGSAYTGNYTSTFLGADASLAVISGLATGSNVGSFASNIAVSGAVLDNYNAPSISNANLVISPRPIAFTPSLATKVIGDADPALEVTISAGSLAPTDALSDVTGAISRTAGEEVAIYDILIGAGIKAANYDITYNASNAAFSITDRPVESTGSTVVGAILATEDEKDERRDGKGRRDRRRSNSGRCFP